jgi:hypothetical protein
MQTEALHCVSQHALVQKIYFRASEAASFWKRGSFRSGSNIGSSRSSAGVSGEVVREVFALLFRRERGDDFLKARIAAQRIPLRIKTQLAAGWRERKFADYA